MIRLLEDGDIILQEDKIYREDMWSPVSEELMGTL